MDSYTIQEKCVLPSKGLLYEGIPEEVTLRSMTTEEEMRRLSQSGSTYQKMCDIIDSCIIETLPISSYDMCIGDYQQLLYKLRTVTYGSTCVNTSICPYCGNVKDINIDLDNLKNIEFNGLEESDLEFDLPRCKSHIKLTWQTPRMLDEVDKEVEDFNKKYPENKLNVTMLFTLKHCIVEIDGKHFDPIKKDMFLKKLLMADTNLLMRKIIKLNSKVGVDSSIIETCPSCGREYSTTFRISSEFFGPTKD
jgi:hypothetical protein